MPHSRPYSPVSDGNTTVSLPWHVSYLAFAVGWKQEYGCLQWGRCPAASPWLALTHSNLLIGLRCSLLGLTGVCPSREEVNSCIGLCGTAWDKQPQDSSFPLLLYFSLGRGCRRGYVRQSPAFPLSAGGLYPLTVSPSSILYHCCSTRETKNRPEDKIPAAPKKHGVWQYLEQWQEAKKKKRLTLTQQSKLMQENLMQGKVCWNKGYWGVSFVFNYDNQYSAHKKKRRCNGLHYTVWRNSNSQVSQNMSQINCIENILGFFKKKKERKIRKGSGTSRKRQHTKIYFWVLQNIELKITLKMKFAMNLKLLNSQRLGLPKALLVSSVLFCLYLNILYSCLCSCVVRTVIYISVHSKMDLRLSQAVHCSE